MNNTYKLTFIYILFIIVFGASATYADNSVVRLNCNTNNTTVTIATPITVTIAIESNPEVLYELTLPDKQTGVFDILDKQTSKIEFADNVNSQTITLTLSTLETGHHLIDLPAITYFSKTDPDNNKKLIIPAIPIYVKSLLTAEKITDLKNLKDIKPPVLLPTDKKKIKKILFIVIGALLLFIIVLWLIAKFFKHKNNPQIHIKTPYEIAMEELISLEREHLIEHHQVKEYYFKLSIIIRKYLEGRFNISAPTLTTEEFFKVVTGKKILNPDYTATLNIFLNSCDYVKFAKYIPSSEEIETTFSSAKNFVEETKQDIDTNEEEIKNAD